MDGEADHDINPVFQMEACPFPIIGAVNGPAATGGFELALACDFLIGSTKARFRDTHTTFGIAPCWGLSQKLPRLVGPQRAKFISFTASWCPRNRPWRGGCSSTWSSPRR